MRAGVEAFFRQQQVAAVSTHWQLLQIAPTTTPGTFKVGAPFYVLQGIACACKAAEL